MVILFGEHCAVHLLCVPVHENWPHPNCLGTGRSIVRKFRSPSCKPAGAPPRQGGIGFLLLTVQRPQNSSGPNISTTSSLVWIGRLERDG